MTEHQFIHWTTYKKSKPELARKRIKAICLALEKYGFTRGQHNQDLMIGYTAKKQVVEYLTKYETPQQVIWWQAWEDQNVLAVPVVRFMMKDLKSGLTGKGA